MLTLAACGQGAGEGPEGDPLPFIHYVTDTPGVGNAALLEGAVVDHEGCLGVEGGGEVFVPVFPAEMEGRAAQMRPGDEVALGGGVASWESIQSLPEVEIPGECAEASEYWHVVDG